MVSSIGATLASVGLVLLVTARFVGGWSRTDAALAAVAALVGGLLAHSIAAAIGMGALIGLALVDARTGLVPFVVAIPAIVVTLLVSIVTAGAFVPLTGALVVGTSVLVVLIMNQHPRLMFVAMLALAFAFVGAQEHWFWSLAASLAMSVVAVVLAARSQSERKLSGGDVLLAILVGAIFGWLWGSFVMVLAVGCATLVWFVFVRGRAQGIVFGPSLALASLILFGIRHLVPIR